MQKKKKKKKKIKNQKKKKKKKKEETNILHSARPSTNTLKFLQIHTIAFGDGYFYKSSDRQGQHSRPVRHFSFKNNFFNQNSF
jgi:hypothetical protein